MSFNIKPANNSFKAKLPNILTVSRIILTILMIFYYYFIEFYKFETLFIAFFLAGISDYFDGYLSRKFHAVSNFGKCLDPISDKLLLIVSLIILIDAKLIHLIIAFILMFREIFISGLREFLSLQKIDLPVSRLAKWKTAFQLIGVGMCFFSQSFKIIELYNIYLSDFVILLPLTFIIQNIKIITLITLLLASYATLYTGIMYLIKSYKYLK